MGRPKMSEKEFFSKVDKSGGESACWPWAGCKNQSGYGVTSIDGKYTATHRAAYFYANGITETHLCVCHSCDNPPCCNPGHLFLGTSPENTANMVSKGRQSKGKSHSDALMPSRKRGEENNLSVMTDEKVMELRKLYSETKIRLKDLAKQFGISYGGAQKIVLGIVWKHLPILEVQNTRARHSKYTQERVNEIRAMRASGMTCKAIAHHFQMSVWTINEIIYRQKGP